ncbi:hypothetical protein B0H13DRAFT_1850935 [Mycena leptocephala]|nr:hypothetical protein B0H13DRAFT_1850935 [Mycena leptocephala]
MNNEKAMMLTTKGCLIAFFNKLFGNNTPGSSLDCIALPRRLPCSNCLPRVSGSLVFEPSPLPSGPERLRPFSEAKSQEKTPAPYRPKNHKLTLKMRAVADAELRKFRAQVQKLEREFDLHGFTPASSYLSNPLITSLLDNLLVIWTREVLVAKIPDWKHHERRGEALYTLIRRLQLQFAAEFEAARLEKNKKARLKRRAAAGWDKMSDGEDEGDEAQDTSASEDEPVHEHPVSPPTEVAKRKRQPAVLEDVTNVQPAAKRARASRAPLESMARVSELFGPQYRPRIRRSNAEN